MANIPVYIEIDGDIRLQGAHALPNSGFYFSVAWEWPAGAGAIVVNIEKAREIQRDTIRKERQDRWEDADAAWFRAQESGDTDAIAAAVVYKQALRDAPEDASIDSATTPAALQTITLDTILG